MGRFINITYSLATLLEGAGYHFFSSAKISLKFSYFHGVIAVKLDSNDGNNIVSPSGHYTIV